MIQLSLTIQQLFPGHVGQCFSTAGTRPGTGTSNIRETKNLSEITMTSSIFKDSGIRKIYYRNDRPQNY